MTEKFSKNISITINPKASTKKYFTSSHPIATSLIQLAEKQSVLLLVLSKASSKEGHAVGFYKEEKRPRYHFFDANAGWFVFNDATNFQNWLSFYFNNRSYDRDYNTYEITSFRIHSEICPNQSPQTRCFSIHPNSAPGNNKNIEALGIDSLKKSDTCSASLNSTYKTIFSLIDLPFKAIDEAHTVKNEGYYPASGKYPKGYLVNDHRMAFLTKEKYDNPKYNTGTSEKEDEKQWRH